MLAQEGLLVGSILADAQTLPVENGVSASEVAWGGRWVPYQVFSYSCSHVYPGPSSLWKRDMTTAQAGAPWAMNAAVMYAETAGLERNLALCHWLWGAGQALEENNARLHSIESSLLAISIACEGARSKSISCLERQGTKHVRELTCKII
jgi:hypothetical protein